MIVKTYDSKEDWLEDRLGCIGGSKLGDVVTYRGNGTKLGVYQLLADRLRVEDNSIDGRDRGNELEKEAIAAAAASLDIDLKDDLVMWVSDKSPYITYSPDGFTKDLKTAAEIKCPGSARHLQTVLENKVPSDYHEQTMQAFVVNPKLKVLHFVSYDPRVASHPLHIIELKREDYEEEIDFYTNQQLEIIDKVNGWAERLAF